MDGRFIGLGLGGEGECADLGAEGGSETLPYFFSERRREN